MKTTSFKRIVNGVSRRTPEEMIAVITKRLDSDGGTTASALSGFGERDGYRKILHGWVITRERAALETAADADCQSVNQCSSDASIRQCVPCWAKSQLHEGNSPVTQRT